MKKSFLYYVGVSNYYKITTYEYSENYLKKMNKL